MAAAFSSSCRPTSPVDRRLATMPEPITATISIPVPNASAASRRVRSRRSAPVPVSTSRTSSTSLGCSSSVMTPPPTRRPCAIRLAELGQRRVERRLGADRDRVGDRPVQPGVVRVELLVGPVAHGDHQRRAARRSRPGRGVWLARGRVRPGERRPRRRDGPARRDGFPPRLAGSPVASTPQGGRQLRARRVRAAHEQRRTQPGSWRPGARPSSASGSRCT